MLTVRDGIHHLICPTGKSVVSRKNLSSPFRKNISLVPSGKSNPLIGPSRSSKGRFAIVTDVGRDAVDAAVPMRRAALIADGKVVWSWRPDAGVKLAEEIPPATVARKPGHRGEHEISRKPSRGECRVKPV
jgi:hypothetical protein